jgi:hypothetical protein
VTSPAHLLKCALAAVVLSVASPLWADPIGYSVNSRGVDQVDQRVNALWRVNLSNGEAEYIGWTSFVDLEALAFSPENVLYGADDDTNTLVRVSRVTGLAQPIGGAGNRFNTGLTPLSRKLDFGMSFTCEGELYVVSDVERSLFRANLESGALSQIGASGALAAPITDIAVRGSEVFGIGVGLTAQGLSAAPNLYRLDLQTPSAELIGPLGPAAAPYNNAGLSFDGEGNLWAITDRRAVAGQDLPSQVLRIDTESGLATLVSESIIGLESLAIAPPVQCGQEADPPGAGYPIPVMSRPGQAAFVLMMLALGALGLHRRLA